MCGEFCVQNKTVETGYCIELQFDYFCIIVVTIHLQYCDILWNTISSYPIVTRYVDFVS